VPKNWISKEHARQAIPYTDFPLEEVTLYACWDDKHCVIVLPIEYQEAYVYLN